MLRPRWVAVVTALVLTSACTPTTGPTVTGSTPSGPALAADPGDVAVLVLDGFTAAAAGPPAKSGPTANCFRTAYGANEVGSGGGGDELPPGVSHGQAVFEVLRSELSQPYRRLERRSPPTISHGLVQPSFVESWHTGEHRLLLVGVDTANFDTGLIAGELSGIMNVISSNLGINRFVVNMSFVVLPCDVRAWFDAQPGTPLTPDRLLATYRAIVEAVPHLARLAGELDRLERGAPTVDALLREPALTAVQPLVAVNLFYRLLGDHAIDEIIKNPNVPPLTRSAYRQITDDPLKRLLDRPPAGYRVAAVGAAGNGIFRRSVSTGRGERTQFAFPFAPALWNSVVSVSATGPNPPTRAAYANSGEVMMDAANRFHVNGTSFAAPRLAALEALYLYHGGPVRCDGHIPPLGYASVADPAAPGADVARWDNLPLSATAAPGDAALRHCGEFSTRAAPPLAGP